MTAWIIAGGAALLFTALLLAWIRRRRTRHRSRTMQFERYRHSNPRYDRFR